MKKILAIIISIITIGISITFIFSPKKDFSYNENRFLAKLPKLTKDNLISGRYMSKLEDYIVDNFPLRDNLLGFKSNLYKNLGVYKQSDVYYGKDNKLYQEYKKPENNEKIVRRVNNLSNEVNSKIYFMLVPTSIYNSSNIPKYTDTYDEGITLDYFKDNLDVTFIDIRDSFDKNKNEYLYYGTDHHWTTRGAYVAYLDYCDVVGISCKMYDFIKVNDKFYGTLYSKVLDNSVDYDYIEKIDDNTNYYVYYSDKKTISDSLYNEEYLDKKDKYSYFLDNNHSLISIENLDIDTNKSILIIKDSYANSFVPLIAPNYKYTYVIDPRYYTESISNYINEHNIDTVLFLYNVLTMEDDLGILGIS